MLSQRTKMKHSYENALRLLQTRRRKARPKTPALLDSPTPNATQSVRGVPSLVGMDWWLRALGHAVDHLSIIHVAGTKGKGSTCAFTRSFLHEHGLRTGFPRRIGLYTSPDLQCIRERIQIDGKPITEELFTRYFFEVWECLMTDQSPESTNPNQKQNQPRYLQFLALLAFHTFIRENVQVAIVETHHGGEYDTTNVIQNPVVTGITSLGMDHIDQLGPTIENIAWHKAGIFKPGSPAFSVPQEPGPAEVMTKRAAEKQTTLTFISGEDNPALPSSSSNDRVLGTSVQRLNCSLALELAKTFLQAKEPSTTNHTLDTNDISRAIDNFSWIGRFEVIEHADTNNRWILDGAHNTLSLEHAAAWFSRLSSASDAKKTHRILIFSHFSEERDGETLMECLANTLFAHNSMPEHVIFTTYQERKDGSTRIDKTLKVPETPYPDLCSIYASRWKQRDPQATVSCKTSIEEAIELAEEIGAEQKGGGVQAFVTGSLHLVGGALNILRPQV